MKYHSNKSFSYIYQISSKDNKDIADLNNNKLKQDVGSFDT